MTGDQCKAGRALAGLSQKALAEPAEVAVATVAAFERGERTPYRRTLEAIQEALEAQGVQFTPDGVRSTRTS
ncbi:MAG: helix-turn-helix domain-containing protein [Paracoccus sp. (in: a-proteobacteria)]|nr:helix-turn-helix domain-containing protein [Paracoccus sp. (in: a-proteobacteria)]